MCSAIEGSEMPTENSITSVQSAFLDELQCQSYTAEEATRYPNAV